MDKMIEVVNVTKNYGTGAKAVQALRGVDLFARKGEIVSIMGPSGSGKSTLLHLMGGLDVPSGGAVIIDGQDTQKLNDRNLTLLRRRKLGFVFQFFNLLPTMSVIENVAFPLLLQGVSYAKSEMRARELLELVGLQERADHFLHQLSGGEQQRTAIARALVHRPALLIADEPTGNLDSHSADMVMQVLRSIGETQLATLIVVTHSEDVARASSRRITMRDGRIVA